MFFFVGRSQFFGQCAARQVARLLHLGSQSASLSSELMVLPITFSHQ